MIKPKKCVSKTKIYAPTNLNRTQALHLHLTSNVALNHGTPILLLSVCCCQVVLLNDYYFNIWDISGGIRKIWEKLAFRHKKHRSAAVRGGRWVIGSSCTFFSYAQTSPISFVLITLRGRKPVDWKYQHTQKCELISSGK